MPTRRGTQLVCLILAAAVASLKILRPESTTVPEAAPAAVATAASSPKVTHVAQNEYSIWAGQDKHARAYQVLSNAVSLRIGKILNIGRPDQNQKCLACHALSVPTEQRAETFELMMASVAKAVTVPLPVGWVRTPPRTGRMKNPCSLECMIRAT